jgi:hypothetical protein
MIEDHDVSAMNESQPSEETLFEAVSQLPAEMRGAYLTEACAGDAVLRERLEILLRTHKRAGGFMAEPAAPSLARRRRNGPLSTD